MWNLFPALRRVFSNSQSAPTTGMNPASDKEKSPQRLRNQVPEGTFRCQKPNSFVAHVQIENCCRVLCSLVFCTVILTLSPLPVVQAATDSPSDTDGAGGGE